LVAKVAKLVNDDTKFSPGVANLPVVRFDALAPLIAAALKSRRHRREPLEVRGDDLRVRADIEPIEASMPRLAISMFACDIAYPRSSLPPAWSPLGAASEHANPGPSMRAPERFGPDSRRVG
jgi:hypothetical protein